MKINYFVHTEIGDRPCNEDRYAVSKCPAGLCFALADGLGGLDRGEVAAELACNAVAEYAQAQAVFSSAAAEQAFLRAQQAVLARQKAEHNETQMKTTLNVVMLDKQSMYWGHVGDSRTYYAENGVLKRRTLGPQRYPDAFRHRAGGGAGHSFSRGPQQAAARAGHAVGKAADGNGAAVALRGNMQILLCTDGFWEYITEEQIQICLEESDNAQIWMENMLELISRNDQHSERDNRTAITIWIDDGEGDITQ